MMKNEDENWIEKFKKKYGRKPRVLHISNIANNAYNNAKLLNQRGLENHVLSINEYYVMGCPEWEDADFYGDIENLFRPEWNQIDLNGFERPKWFAQGELETCVEYLLALCKGKIRNQEKLFYELSIQNKLLKPEVHNTSSHVRNVNNHSLMRLFVVLRKLKKKLKSILKIIFYELLIKPARYVFFKPCCFHKKIIKRVSRNKSKINTSYLNPCYCAKIEKKIDLLVKLFKITFEDRSDCLKKTDFTSRINTSKKISFLLDNYDVVVGYSTEGIYPLLKGIPYFCYEHGTLRDIPYADDTQGRLCALTYSQATHVFVTNFDCKKSAEFLAPGKYTMVNHAYDEDHPDNLALDWKIFRINLANKLDSKFLLFHPTRHDWVVGDGYADKANDVFLKAFAELRQSGLQVGLVCCDWGHNVEHSKKLIEELGVSEYVQWQQPLGIVSFTRMCKACNLVADQFFLGAFGGITFKALATGAAILSRIDESLILNQYPEVPPIINCKTQEDIKSSIAYYYSHADELDKIGAKGKAWMKKNHNKNDLIDAQLAEFEKILF